MANQDIFGIGRKRKKLAARTDGMASEYAEELAGQALSEARDSAGEAVARAARRTATENSTEMFGVAPKRGTSTLRVGTSYQYDADKKGWRNEGVTSETIPDEEPKKKKEEE